MFLLFTKCCCFFEQKSDDIRIINTDKSKEKIIIGYCRRYETFIFIIKLQGYKGQYKRLVPKKFSYKLHTNSKYGKLLLKNVEIANVITKKNLIKYPHLDLKGEIIIKKDHVSSIAEIKLHFENYFPAFVCVWPKDFVVKTISLAESDISFEETALSSKSL